MKKRYLVMLLTVLCCVSVAAFASETAAFEEAFNAHWVEERREPVTFEELADVEGGIRTELNSCVAVEVSPLEEGYTRIDVLMDLSQIDLSAGVVEIPELADGGVALKVAVVAHNETRPDGPLSDAIEDVLFNAQFDLMHAQEEAETDIVTVQSGPMTLSSYTMGSVIIYSVVM